ncbi:hypothetical protein MCUN1_002231 [Malassezia cuniculi]|uniref:Glyoxylate reductase n=1 Tax=Malassezia cuniculi TaxID=948313 RepID=A0AAF0EZ53_9BASI|nr:hypothetical protein MCUN1_002231 [Malassezia cuniculi]
MIPTILEVTRLPTPILRRAAEAGKIRLISWADTNSKAPFADREWILRNVPGVNALAVIVPTAVDAEILDAAGPSLKGVSTMSVGYDHIDAKAVRERGLRIGNTPQVLDSAVADLTISLTLSITRRLFESERVVRAGKWQTTPWNPLAFIGPSLEGKTIGFFGFGGIAQTTAARLLSFKPGRIVYTTSKPRTVDLASPAFRVLAEDDYIQLHHKAHGKLPVPMDNVPDRLELARVSDVVIVLAVLNESTHHAVDAEFLDAMKPTAYVVNVARGPHVDTGALVDALRQEKIAGAALDVLEGEPNIPADHPLLAADIADRVVVLPHIASATSEARHAMADICATNALGMVGLGEMISEL